MMGPSAKNNTEVAKFSNKRLTIIKGNSGCSPKATYNLPLHSLIFKLTKQLLPQQKTAATAPNTPTPALVFFFVSLVFSFLSSLGSAPNTPTPTLVFFFVSLVFSFLSSLGSVSYNNFKKVN